MAKNSAVLDEKFEQVGQVSIDSKNRIVLKKAIGKIREQLGDGQLRFAVAFNRAGQILLSPEATIPAHEAWLYKNPKALASVLRGLQDAKEGKLGKKLPSFAKYADVEID